MPRLKLTYASCKYDRIEALRLGEVEPGGIDLNVMVFPSGRQIFDRMVGGLEFDASGQKIRGIHGAGAAVVGV